MQKNILNKDVFNYYVCFFRDDKKLFSHCALIFNRAKNWYSLSNSRKYYKLEELNLSADIDLSKRFSCMTQLTHYIHIEVTQPTCSNSLLMINTCANVLIRQAGIKLRNVHTPRRLYNKLLNNSAKSNYRIIATKKMSNCNVTQ